MGNHHISCDFCGEDERYVDCNCKNARESREAFYKSQDAAKEEKFRRSKLSIEERWEQGIEHHNESVKLIKLINKLDTNDELCLDLGGDGDLGETLAYYLDELIDRDLIEIKIKGKL